MLNTIIAILLSIGINMMTSFIVPKTYAKKKLVLVCVVILSLFSIVIAYQSDKDNSPVIIQIQDGKNNIQSGGNININPQPTKTQLNP